MIRNIFKRFSPKPSDVPREVSDFAKGIVENELATFQMQANARRDDEAYVLLTPTVPLPAKQKAGWFGGNPCLPDDVPWPEIGGERLRFVCQLNLAALPQDIWSGVGPRQGWLVYFLHPTEFKTRVLRVAGRLRSREGPGQSDVDWFKDDYRNPEPVRNHSPEWPVTITRHVGPLPHGFGHTKSTAPEFQNLHNEDVGDLSNPAFQPFNEETLELLLGQLQQCLEWKRSQIEVFLPKKLNDKAIVHLVEGGGIQSMRADSTCMRSTPIQLILFHCPWNCAFEWKSFGNWRKSTRFVANGDCRDVEACEAVVIILRVKDLMCRNIGKLWNELSHSLKLEPISKRQGFSLIRENSWYDRWPSSFNLRSSSKSTCATKLNGHGRAA
jgi:Domain of unknown function (DUF1963)